MKVSSERDRITKEAADWLVALEDSPEDPELQVRFHAWLVTHHDHALAWSHVVDVYGMMAKVPPLYENRWAPHARGEGTARSSKQVLSPLGITSAHADNALRWLAGALAACVASLIFPTVTTMMHADFAHSDLAVKSFHLEDGSHIRLGPHSAVMSVLMEEKRLVHLYQGQVFFEVSTDANRPFEVEAHHVKTTVLGTAFDVRVGEQGVTVGVRQGRVQVDNGNPSRAVEEKLEPGEWVQVFWTGAAHRGRTVPEEIALWAEGQLIARDQRLSEIVTELSRYYTGSIVFADESLGQRRISGVYNLHDPVAALRAAVGVHGGSISESSGSILIHSPQ